MSEVGNLGAGSFSGLSRNLVDLETGLSALQIAVDLMNSNKYHEAVRLLKPKANISMYHSMAYGSVLFLQAGFCMEREAISNATEELNKTVELCNSCRRPKGMMESLSGWMFGQRLDNHTPSELQAEVFYAEANLLLSFLTFLQDESLMSFVKGGLRIRSCYSTYKQLYQWLETCHQEGLPVEENFSTGIKMGYGCFNLYLSLLPARILKLLEFIGFAVDKEVGLQELKAAASSNTFRAPLCSSFLLFYYTVAAVITGIDLEADHAETLLQPQLTKYPESVQFLYFKGRVAAMKGDINKAIECFLAAISAQDEWRQVCHLCWWELAWCHSLKCEWGVAAQYSHQLYTESKWSKASFLYMKASFLLMQQEFASRDQSNNKDFPSAEQSLPQDSPPAEQRLPPADHHLSASEEELVEMMRKIPTLKLRIAGKSLPIEKFAVAKSERFLGGSCLPLSGMELLYSHNAYLLLRGNPHLLEQLLSQAQEKLHRLEDTKDTNPCYDDDYTVITFISGCILRVLARHSEAEQAFLEVIENAQHLQHDLYTTPAAMAELGLLYITTGQLEQAEKSLLSARNDFKGYHLESRIHFRIHAGLNRIQQLKKSQT